ncbi:hypothetical protein KY495_22725 [Massilia sp. PAMC28688]|uniref:hypothetical protein n=1 Tax=Massilia sp. PAMC28688 TaxID=2861283 RepID=UPI001C625D87|nr:hypothetical protein [Massilia sp. PAMC28688]QYF93445.1 hypothetical protein KY495_22725 [Massilia sp. PAMC28688]
MSKSEQPPIPTHPADPAANQDQDKVVGKPGAVRGGDYNDPPPEGAVKSTGQPIDDAGGAGLGKPPGQ